MQARVLSTLLYLFHSSEALKEHSMWVNCLYFVSRRHTYCIFSFNDPGTQVNTNGVLSFRGGFTQFTSQRFPLSNGRSLIAPFWDDVDIRTSEGRFGDIYYRLTFNTTLLERARDQVQELFPSPGSFTPTQLVIATWDRVAEFGQRGPQVSTCMNDCFVLVLLSWFTLRNA